MKVAITGATGLIGSGLTRFLHRRDHDVTPLVRKRSTVDGGVFWDPATGEIEAEKLESFDAVVHLAGENINGRWTTAKKERIRGSRVQGTALLARTLAELHHPPRVWICSSAVGIYGDRGDEVLTEESEPGEGFLADVVRAWEAATRPAAGKGIRIVHARSGMVLSRRGGALAAMLLPFRLGLGGRIGPGNQIVPFVSLEDCCSALLHLLHTETLEGPVNVVAGDATNLELVKALGAALHRPTIFPMPAFMARAVFGRELADTVLLSSQRVEAPRLLASGWTPAHPDIGTAVQHALTADL